MDDLQGLETDFWKPFVTVLNYFRFSATDIFDEYQLLKLLKIKHIFILLHVMMTIGVLCFLKEAISNGCDLLDVAIDLSYAIVCIEGCLLYIHFLYSKKKIKSFVLRLGEEWRDDGSLSLDLVASRRKKIKSLDRFNYVYFTAIAIFVHSYMLIPLTTMIIKKFVFKEDVVYVLPFRWTVPFNYEDNFLLYLIVYGYMYVLTINLSYLINGGLLLLTVCINQLRVLFDLLQDEFRDIFNSKDDFNMDDRIKQNVQRHTNLLKFIRELSTAFGAIFIIHLFFVAATICFFGIAAMVNRRLEDFKNVMGSVISIITIYHCCHHGQLLADSAVDVGTATYDSEWYSLSCKYKKIVLIIILRSQQITYVQSTGFTHISLTTFIKIMNMTWSLISVVTGMYNKK